MTGARGLRDVRKEPRAKEHGQPLEAGGGQERNLRWSLRKEPALPTS